MLFKTVKKNRAGGWRWRHRKRSRTKKQGTLRGGVDSCLEEVREGVVSAAVRGPESELPGSSSVVSARSLAVMPSRSTNDSDGRWFVESLVLGDGTADKNGFSMVSGVIHASAQAKSGHESYHPVVWDAAIFRGARNGKIEFPTSAVSTHRNGPICVVPDSCDLRQISRRSRSEIVAEHVHAFLRQHPGLAVITSGIAGRKNVSWPETVKRTVRGQPMATALTHDCVRAGLINAVFAVSGASAARCVCTLLAIDARMYRSLRPLSVLLDRAKESVIGCRIVRDAELQRTIQCADRLVAFRALSARREGVFLVRLREGSRVDHAVVVDVNSGVIIDSEEECVLVLSAEILQRCGGDDAKKLRVCEIREIKRSKYYPA